MRPRCSGSEKRPVSLAAASIGAALFLVGCSTTDPDSAEGLDGVDAERVRSDLSDELTELGLTSLASAIEEIDVADLVDGSEFTLLAPTDEAFSSLDADALADMLSEPERLRDTLRNHIIASPVDAAGLREHGSVTTALGNRLDVEDSADGLAIAGATVVDPDNGTGPVVIHVVDSILVP